MEAPSLSMASAEYESCQDSASPFSDVVNDYLAEEGFTPDHDVVELPADDDWELEDLNFVDHQYFNGFPSGVRFCPYDAELVQDYLARKLMGQPLPMNKIIEVNLYKYNPETLAEKYEHCGEREWYFFTPRDRKYKHGQRPNRAAGDGYWKATGADKEVRKTNGVTIGFKKSLVFYKGKPPKGDKTDWIMHEYRVEHQPLPRQRADANDMRLDDYVLCMIYKKKGKGGMRRIPRLRYICKDDSSPDSEPVVPAVAVDHLHQIAVDDPVPAVAVDDHNQIVPNDSVPAVAVDHHHNQIVDDPVPAVAVDHHNHIVVHNPVSVPADNRALRLHPHYFHGVEHNVLVSATRYTNSAAVDAAMEMQIQMGQFKTTYCSPHLHLHLQQQQIRRNDADALYPYEEKWGIANGEFNCDLFNPVVIDHHHHHHHQYASFLQQQQHQQQHDACFLQQQQQQHDASFLQQLQQHDASFLQQQQTGNGAHGMARWDNQLGGSPKVRPSM